jgi:biotin synthase
MDINSKIRYILDKALGGDNINKEEALSLMEVDLYSYEMHAVYATASKLSREQFKGKGDCHAQIGLDLSPCPNNCGFCSFALEAGVFKDKIELKVEEVISRAQDFVKEGANAIYLMTTANYSFDNFLEIGREVKKSIPADIPLVANIGDFGVKEAERLIDAGFQGAYHVRRLREGKDTRIDPEKRLATMKAIKKSGLMLLHCVEPVGPEHTAEEVVDLMFEGKEYGASFSGAMRRIPVPGTSLADLGIISEIELAKIVAISRLVMGTNVKGHCTHEPNMFSLLAGANLFFPETGPNPRDLEEETSKGRGFTVEKCKEMFREAKYTPLEGPSPVFKRT